MSEFCGFEVQVSEELGRIVVAKRDFRVGDLILVEEPLVISPIGKQAGSLRSQNLPEDFNKSTFECVGCFKTLSAEYSEVCPKCLFPVCGKACAEEPRHAKYECPLFEEKKISVSEEVYAHMYILRGVLMYQDQSNTTTWDQIATLNSSYKLKHKDCLASNIKKRQKVRQVCTFLRQRFHMNIAPKILGQIIGAFNVNAFDVSGEDQHGNSYTADALFNLCSMFCHGCAPNAEWIVLPYDYNGAKKWTMRVYSRRNILRDEPISISYIPDCFAVDGVGRRRYILNHYHFYCKCSRCLDATEFSFYTEAIKCPSCDDDKLTADEPLDEFSTWTCNHCGMSEDYRYAKKCVENFKPSLFWNSPSQADLPTSLTSTNETGRLNENHREIILTAFFRLEEHSLQKFQEMYQHSKGRDESFVTLMKMATKCRKVFGMFGGMPDIVDLEMWIARAIAAYYFKTVDFLSIPYDPYLPEEKLKITSAIYEHLKLAYDIVEWSPYNALYLHLRQDLIDGYNFWKDEFNALKNKCGALTSGSSDELNEVGVRVTDTVDELKTSLNTVNEPFTDGSHEGSEVLKEAVEMEKVAASQSSNLLHPDVITSSGECNSITMKPPVALLTELDFYFDQ